jgi:hypothetical protein
MSTTTLPGGITAASAAEQLQGGAATTLTAADSTSAVRIQNLSLVLQARVSQLTRTAASQTAQYGPQSQQAVTAQAAVTAAQTKVARVQLVHQQVATPDPQVAATGWVLHGRIYNAQLQPAVGYCVFLVDGQKNYLSEYGFAYTDTTGYFLISYAGAAAVSGRSTSSAETTPEIFLQVASPSPNPVYLSAVAFQPKIGAATYQTVTLPAGEPALGDPPSEIRKVAFPPAEKGS